jgi:hypothetical protein
MEPSGVGPLDHTIVVVVVAVEATIVDRMIELVVGIVE